LPINAAILNWISLGFNQILEKNNFFLPL